ncbi:MAG: hypothetical protein AB1634_09735 [Thermodesulfobacteriota bacterium]
MTKLILSLFLGVLLLIFTSQNLHQAWVRFVIGQPVQLPMIVIIAGAFLLGYLLATFSHLMRRATRRAAIPRDGGLPAANPVKDTRR